MTNFRSRFPYAFVALVVMGIACTGCQIDKTKSTSTPQSIPPEIPGGSQKMYNIVMFLMGTTGIALGILGLTKANHASKANRSLSLKLRERMVGSTSDMKQLSDELMSINSAVKEYVRKQNATESKVEQLILKYANLSTMAEYQSSSHLRPPLSTSENVSLNQPADLLRSNAIQNRAPGPSHSLFSPSNMPASTSPPPSTPAKSAAHQQENLTAAVNRNDRQAIRSAMRTQLNITNDSENAIAIGRLTQTELEEVLGGGSYLLLTSENEMFLYPTDQTLKGFGQVQPSKGVFTYLKQSIATPQVLTPALVELVGIHWRVKQLGTIAFPG